MPTSTSFLPSSVWNVWVECQCSPQKDYTMRLWIDPVKMKSYGLIPADLTGVLAQQNIEAAPGSVGESSDNQYQYTFRYKGL